MKKFLLAILVIASIAISNQVNAQASCPVITRYFVNKVPNTSNEYKILFYFYNPTSGNKNIVVTVGGLTPAPTTMNLGCYDAKGQQNVIRNYTTPSFITNNLGALTLTFTSYTGNDCGGTLCSSETHSNIPLPVNFKSFNANRNKSNVSLTWETSYESNNRGFEIQRKTTGNDFSTIAFVDTKASGGNSDKDIAYTFQDMNPVKGVSQYRIQQIDFDGKSKYTEIKTVRGEEQSSKTIVYPNPSNNGVVNVVFEDFKSLRDIQLMDINGRTMNQWKNYTNNHVKLENLASGIYNLRVIDHSTREQFVEKIVVNRN